MAGLLDALIRRAAPGGYQETPEEQYRKSVMSPDYVPETSGRNVLYGGIRGLLDATPAGLLDAAQAGLNRLPTAGGALVRAITGRAQGPVDAGMGLLGMQGSGPGYEAGRAASGAAVAGMGLLGNQAGGQLPRGYARDQSGAIVWHGSPHKFDKFDSSKIGTGEGAQAYGHGLYFAGSRDVGSQYMGSTAANKYETSVGVISSADLVDELVKNAGQVTPQLKAAYQAKANEVVRDLIMGSDAKTIAEKIRTSRYANTYEGLAKSIEKLSPKGAQGNLYQVDLPDEQIARMLDWDKPLSQQPEAVRKAFEKAMKDAGVESYKTDGMRVYLGVGAEDGLRGQEVYRRLVQDARDGAIASGRNAATTLPAAQADASDYLRSLEVPGIRYLDGGSRTAGAGTSNYVVFPGNEGLLKILGRE